MESVEPGAIEAIMLGRLDGAHETAPEGYTWVVLNQAYLTFDGSPARALMCMACAALVGVHEAHTKWHEDAR